MEVLISVAFLGIAATAIAKISQIHSDAAKRSNYLRERAAALDFSANLLKNREAWSNTVSRSKALQTFFEGGAYATTSADLEIRDADNRAIIVVGGSYLNADFREVSANKARWYGKASWKGKPGSIAEVTVSITPVFNAVKNTKQTRTVRSLNRSIENRCMVLRATIRGDGGGTRYDKGSVSCPSPYIRTGVAIAPGCGALAPRAQPELDDEATGNCYQISSPLTAECPTIATNSGICEVTCCVFD